MLTPPHSRFTHCFDAPTPNGNVRDNFIQQQGDLCKTGGDQVDQETVYKSLIPGISVVN